MRKKRTVSLTTETKRRRKSEKRAGEACNVNPLSDSRQGVSRECSH